MRGPGGPIKYMEVPRGVLGTRLPSLESISATVAEKIAFEVREVGTMACCISMHCLEGVALFLDLRRDQIIVKYHKNC